MKKDVKNMLMLSGVIVVSLVAFKFVQKLTSKKTVSSNASTEDVVIVTDEPTPLTQPKIEDRSSAIGDREEFTNFFKK